MMRTLLAAPKIVRLPAIVFPAARAIACARQHDLPDLKPDVADLPDRDHQEHRRQDQQ
jgi:hypothetical protein